MKTELKTIMINKGDEITCLHDLKVNGTRYFTAGKKYNSTADNCLTNDFGEDNFISQQYLPYFFE